MDYWLNKHERAKTAVQHIKDMQTKYQDRIAEVAKNTKIYGVDAEYVSYVSEASEKETEISVIDMDSVSAVMEFGGVGSAVLNFASYKNPGGMFTEGSCAQEECLCHGSFLYNVLNQFVTGYYDWNRSHKNKALYLNRALYSPGVLFCRHGDGVECDVITCAAPNKRTAMKYQHVTESENTKALRERIEFVLGVAASNHVHTLILGAFGCGVFGQDAEEVARIFKEYLDEDYWCFDTVIFAIPDDHSRNYQDFKRVFGRSN